MKRAVLTGSFAAALVIAALALLLVMRSRDGAALVPERVSAKIEEGERAGERGALELPAVADESRERVEADETPSIPPLESRLLSDSTPSARFRGRLVYESTGQGVPWCGVELRGSSPAVEFCTTDDEGRFHSTLPFSLARTLVLVLDRRIYEFDWDRAIEVRRDDGENEVTINARVGPTLVLADNLPKGLEPSTLTASIASLDDILYFGMSVRAGGQHWFAREDLPAMPDAESARARMKATLAEIQLHMADLGESQLSAEAKRSAEQARLESTEFALASLEAAANSYLDQIRIPRPPWKVSVMGERSQWKGTAVLDQLEGVVAVTPHWDSLGDVALEFHGNWSTPPAWSVFAELRSGPTDPAPKSAYGNLNPLDEKPLHFFGLEPGRYALSIRCGTCDDVEMPVVVRSAETTTVDVQMNCAVSAGSIRGEITSQSGQRPRETIYLNLWRPGLGSFDGWIETVDDTLSPWKATFEIKDVLAGKYQLNCSVGEFGVSPSPSVAAQAGDMVQLRVLDDPTYIDLGFRVFDAEGGAQLDTFDIEVHRNGNVSNPRGLNSGAIVVEHLPESGQLWWSVSSAGHVFEQGNVADQTTWGLSSGAKRWIDVRLQRGWRIKISVLDPEGRGLEGATLVADGKDMGTSDADGYFTLTLPQRPQSLEARYHDWRCTESEIDRLPKIESCDEFLFVFERKH